MRSGIIGLRYYQQCKSPGLEAATSRCLLIWKRIDRLRQLDLVLSDWFGSPANAVSPYNGEKILTPAQWSLPFKAEIAFHATLTVPWLKKYTLPLMETKNPISLSWSPAPDSVLSCMSPVYSLSLYFLVMYFYIILTSMSGSFKWSISLWFPVNVLLISSTPRPFHFSLVLSPYGYQMSKNNEAPQQ